MVKRPAAAVAALVGGLLASAPANADYFSSSGGWAGSFQSCTANALSVCMTFSLANVSGNNWAITFTYDGFQNPVPGGNSGLVKTVGLYRPGAPDLAVSNLSTNRAGWTASTNGSGGGVGAGRIEVKADGQGAASFAAGESITVFFTANLAAYSNNLHGLAHIRALAVDAQSGRDCSIWIQSGAASNLNDPVDDVNQRCGTPPPPPPPPSSVPEPMTVVLLGSGILGVGFAQRRRRLATRDDA